MSNYTIYYTLPILNRNQMRSDLIQKMLLEEPGTGSGDSCSRYEYVVEKYGNYEIYLKRPTQLNKGFDFTVNVRGLWFKKQRRYSNPCHSDIVDILTDCKNNNPSKYKIIKDYINDIYNCRPVDFDVDYPINIVFYDSDNNPHPIEIILLSIKWLFMEQDCAYWNYSGRLMLYEKLKEHKLV